MSLDQSLSVSVDTQTCNVAIHSETQKAGSGHPYAVGLLTRALKGKENER